MGGELRVAHDLVDARPARTLRSFDLQPLAQRIRRVAGRWTR
ncbi:hypothetical protein [Lentzea sp. NEAU-D7]|nr:hypothetical protein [Lentzea sp. NEAU-D7]MCX2951601.1 hypothetical protein [Lentzea sp. NEAU-D7]